jgi:hypothetical protein
MKIFVEVDLLKCHSCAKKVLDSAVMTMWAKSMISYGLIQYHCIRAPMWCLILLFSHITCSRILLIPRIAVLGFVTSR